MKVLFMVLLALVSLSLPARAQMTCDTVTYSHGPFGGALYRLPATGGQIKLGFAAGWTWQVNLVPTSDCSVRWLSVVAGGLTSVSNAPVVLTGAAWSVSPVAGVGLYNSLLRLLIQVDAISVGPDLTGIVVGRVGLNSVAFLLATGVQFDLQTGTITPQQSAAVRPPLKPGYVRQ